MCSKMLLAGLILWVDKLFYIKVAYQQLAELSQPQEIIPSILLLVPGHLFQVVLVMLKLLLLAEAEAAVDTMVVAVVLAVYYIILHCQ